MATEYDGRVYLVTGAAQGIGGAVAHAIQERGGTVVGADIRIPDNADPAITWAACDVADQGQVDLTVAKAVGIFGRLDGVVNAAGVTVAGRFLEFDDATWERVFKINVQGSYHVIRAAAPHLVAAGGGRIVNVASMAGKLPNPYTAPYAASKAALISLTRSAAAALAPQITVNAVCPGIIDTAMWEELEAGFRAIDAPIDFRSRAAQAPLGRPGTAEEVAGSVLYLLSDGAAFVTGEDLNVSGGLVMH